ncbi:MAG TPA: YhjD/YihY/BrkB family envelope integrity protein [Gaiellaceae bacterium]|nr:YhjD/YihY/BrkB family envelope integrity protein [Gaiellaceae bacterium]
MASRREQVRGLSKRAQTWVARQDPASRKGVAIDAWRRYRAVEGPLQSALLSLYMLVAVLPAVLVIEEYFDAHPAALANRLVHHYGLNADTASLLRSVLADTRVHELGSALFAIAGALFFGLGFGRVLQLVHMRAWRVSVPSRASDQGLYAAVLVGLYGLIVLLLFQLSELKGNPWPSRVLALGWAGLLILFFTWAPWLLLHRQVGRRDLLPGAVLTAVGLVGLTIVSRWVIESWVNLYARDYGGLGVVLAIYFWIALYSFVIVAAASLAPALAQRRHVSHE